MLFECFKSEQNAPFLAMGRSDGVSKLITGVSEELRRIMSLTGCSNLETFGSELIWD
jgi:isopentenyl diphosphate isomerase/L-lactate dehydrogenase-like FMN-dependent dehydrogenase